MICKRKIILTVMSNGWYSCNVKCRYFNQGRCSIFGELKLLKGSGDFKRHSSCKHAHIAFNKLNKEQEEIKEYYGEME